MTIIALAYKEKAKSDFHTSILYAFFEPAWAGNHIVETELHITSNDLLDYKGISVSDSYESARKKAYLNVMSEQDYNNLF